MSKDFVKTTIFGAGFDVSSPLCIVGKSASERNVLKQIQGFNSILYDLLS